MLRWGPILNAVIYKLILRHKGTILLSSRFPGWWAPQMDLDGFTKKFINT